MTPPLLKAALGRSFLCDEVSRITLDHPPLSGRGIYATGGWQNKVFL